MMGCNYHGYIHIRLKPIEICMKYARYAAKFRELQQ